MENFDILKQDEAGEFLMEHFAEKSPEYEMLKRLRCSFHKPIELMREHLNYKDLVISADQDIQHACDNSREAVFLRKMYYPPLSVFFDSMQKHYWRYVCGVLIHTTRQQSMYSPGHQSWEDKLREVFTEAAQKQNDHDLPRPELMLDNRQTKKLFASATERQKFIDDCDESIASIKGLDDKLHNALLETESHRYYVEPLFELARTYQFLILSTQLGEFHPWNLK